MPIGTIYHSGHVLLLAKAAHDRSAVSKYEAEVCISLCASALEGFLNETAHSFSLAESSESAVALAEVLTEAENSHLSPVIKFRLAAFIVSGRFPRRGDMVIQRLTVLIKLRNSLMHLKPEPMFTLDEAHPLHDNPQKPPSEVALLISEGVIKVPKNYSGSWRQLVATPDVARWAYMATVDAMQWLTSVAVDTLVRERLEFQTQGLPEIINNVS